MRSLGLAATAACSHHAATVDAGGPDLTLLGDEMAPSLLVRNEVFAPDDCAVVEGCLASGGAHTLLRFTTVTANIGTADIALPPIPPPGVSDDIYIWSPCHMHHHIRGYADYELLDGAAVVVAGHKQAFCLQDTQQLDPSRPGEGFTCAMPGLSAGWADSYDRELACQWIDITGVAPGTYTLSVRINVESRLPDIRADNDEWTTPVSL
jgi:hypothetical protein